MTLEQFEATLAERRSAPRDTADAARRRLMAYGDRIEPVVPASSNLASSSSSSVAPSASPGAWQSMNEWAVKQQVAAGDKKVAKVDDKLLRKLDKISIKLDKRTEKHADDPAKLDKAERKRREAIDKRLERFRKGGGEPIYLAADGVHVETREHDVKVAKRNAVLWLVVMPISLDDSVLGAPPARGDDALTPYSRG